MSTDVQNPLEQIPWTTPPLVSPIKNPELDQRVKKELGMLPTIMPYLYANPTFINIGLVMSKYYPAHLPGDLPAFIHLVVSQDNSCRYCYGTSRSMLKLLGYAEEKIRKLEQDLYLMDLRPADKKALEVFKKISRAQPRPGPADWHELKQAGFNDAQIREIVFEASQSCFSNRFATCLAIPPDAVEAMAAKPIMKLMRPLIAWQIRKSMKPGQVSLAFSGPYIGPCEALLRELRDLPGAAAMLRTILETCWTSQALPKRTKAMMVAVVSRSVGCPSSEGAACRVLEAEGFSASEVQQIVTRLTADRLTPLEKRLVPFARETTLRLRSNEIQQKCREACEGERDEVVIEVAAVAALGNLVSRLSLLHQLN